MELSRSFFLIINIISYNAVFIEKREVFLNEIKYYQKIFFGCMLVSLENHLLMLPGKFAGCRRKSAFTF